MKISLKWLRQYVDIAVSPAELANRLTMAGSEVKGKQVIGNSWENIFVGQITAVNPHPNADRLTLVTVDLGKENQTVVCGAPNVYPGAKIAFAQVEAQLIDGHTGQLSRLKPAKIRGIVSSGMVCSEKELGLSDSHEGILILPGEAPIGVPLADYLGDVIFDLEVTPNRPDCLSIIGMAREAAVLTGQRLHLPEVSYPEAGAPVDRQAAVEIVAPDLCPRYCASLITGIKAAPSPRWMQEALQACGMRPINNIVDITNYVMLEYGQPLHAFDYQMIRGQKIIVRRANDGETITSLDGMERNLSSSMLVIADIERAIAVAGVMGGANSEVTEQTGTILLEAASFKPTSIHYTARTLRMTSEASLRFERGIRPELTVPALKRATELILQLDGGEAAKGIIDVYPGRVAPKPILLNTDAVKRVLGIEFSLDQTVGVLTSLGFACQPADAKSVMVTVPYWRSDIRQAVDLAEEVARIAGYDKIPATLLGQPLPKQDPAPIIGLKRAVRQRLAGYGFQEIVAYSLISQDMLTRLSPEPHALAAQTLRLANPMTAEQEVLRPTLRANLLLALAANRRYEEGGIRLFELARVYVPRAKDLPDEREVVCGLLSEQREEKSWPASKESVDFYDAKGVVEDLLCRLGVPASFAQSAEAGLHPSRQAVIMADGYRIGVLGEVHPKVLQAFEIAEPAELFELDLPALLPFAMRHRPYQPLPRFPAIVRDMALVVDLAVTHEQVRNIMESFPMVAQVEVFDVYTGGQVVAGKKSLAYRITYQSPARTLTDEEVNEVQLQVLTRLAQEFGAALRG